MEAKARFASPKVAGAIDRAAVTAQDQVKAQ